MCARTVGEIRVLTTVLALAGTLAFADAPADRFGIYQEKVKGRESGVYAVGEDLYVQVKMPAGTGSRAASVRAKAVMAAHDLLRQWVIDSTASARSSGGVTVPEGVRLMMAVNDSIVPQWRFLDWKMSSRGQEFNSNDGKVLQLGQIFAKADVLASVPESFSKAVPPKDQIVNSLRSLFPMALKKDRHRLEISLFGSASAKTEKDRADTAVTNYLENTSFAAELQERARRLRTPHVMMDWYDVPAAPETTSVTNEVVTTNCIAGIKAETNEVRRVATPAELETVGMPHGARFLQTTVTCDNEQIVETKTVTVVTMRKTVRRCRTVTTVGAPTFEDVFLSGGRTVCPAAERTAMGEQAMACYFDKVTTVETKASFIAKALCENPGDAGLWNLRARCFMVQKDYIGALICLRAAAVLDPDNPFVHANLALCYNSLGFDSLARAHGVFVRGVTDDTWCIDQVAQILGL